MKKLAIILIIDIIFTNLIISQSGVSINTNGIPADNSAILDISSLSKGLLIPRMTTGQRNNINLPAQSLLIFNITTNCYEAYVNGQWYSVSCPPPCSPPATPVSGTNTSMQTQITWNWNTVAEATGYKWSTTNVYSSANDNGGTATITQSNLTCNGTYTLYIWAYNACGNSNSISLTQTTSACGSCNSNTWTQLNPTGGPPDVRYISNAVWDDTDNQMLMFGGQNNSPLVVYNDLWSYNPSSNSWTQLNPSGPLPGIRASAAVVWDKADKQMLVFSGNNNGIFLNDFWAYKPSINTWTQLNPSGGPPQSRFTASAVWDPNNNQMIIYGGENGGGGLSDIWSYKPSSNFWTQIIPSGTPPPLMGQATAWDATNNRMLVFGGLDYLYQNILWSYTPSTNIWEQLYPSGTLPSPRETCVATWDGVHNRMYMFGGVSSSGNLNDLWYYSAPSNTWVQVSPTGGPPSPRWAPVIVTNTEKDVLYLFGGDSGWSGPELNDLWQYCPGN
jgi:N-acetylneuraminic acid mutarotase